MIIQHLSQHDIEKYLERGRECQIFGFLAREVCPKEVFCFIGFLDEQLTNLQMKIIKEENKHNSTCMTLDEFKEICDSENVTFTISYSSDNRYEISIHSPAPIENFYDKKVPTHSLRQFIESWYESVRMAAEEIDKRKKVPHETIGIK